MAEVHVLMSNTRVCGVGDGCPGLGSAIITVGGTSFIQNSLTCPVRGVLAGITYVFLQYCLWGECTSHGIGLLLLLFHKGARLDLVPLVQHWMS